MSQQIYLFVFHLGIFFHYYIGSASVMLSKCQYSLFIFMMLPLPYLQALNETAWEHNKHNSSKVIFFCLSQCYYIMASRSVQSVHLVMLVLEMKSADMLYMRSEVCLRNVGKSGHNLPASAAAIFSQYLPFPLAYWFLSHSSFPFFLFLRYFFLWTSTMGREKENRVPLFYVAKRSIFVLYCWNKIF